MLAAFMQKIGCDDLGNKNAATIHRETANMSDLQRENYFKQADQNKASVLPVAMFKQPAPETLEKRKYLKRDPGLTHRHAVFKL